MMDMKRNTKQIHSLTQAAIWTLGFAAMGLGLTGCGIGLSSSSSATGTSPVAHGRGSITGNIHGGQNPVSGAAIQLYAVGSGSLSSAASPLIPVGDQVVYTGSAGSGALTDATGNFNITGDYVCPSPSPQVYLVATGGNSGSGTNSAIALMAPLGDCATLVTNAATTYVQINELTTVASVYALAPFMTSFTNVGAPAVNSPGLITAVGNFNSLVNLQTGVAGGASLPSGAVVPTTELNTLGNIIAACINTSSNTSSACNTLFGATGATDTIGAALAFAKNPGSTTLTALYALGSSYAPFMPTYKVQPADWTMPIRYTAGGTMSGPYGIAIDAGGNAYISNTTGNSVIELSPAGSLVNTLSGGGLIGPKGLAIDRTNGTSGGNVWVTNPAQNSIVKFNNSGVLQSSFTVGGLNGPVSIAMDSAGNAWVANLTGNSVTELSNLGAATQTSLTAGGTISGPTGIALDINGNVYVANSGGGNVVKLTSAGAVATGSPLSDVALQGTSAIAVDTSGNVWAPGSTTGTAVAGAVSQFGSTGSASLYSPIANGGLNLPVSVATSGTTAWVINSSSAGSLSQLSAGAAAPVSPAFGFGTQEVTIGSVAQGGVIGLNAPAGVAVDPSGSVWVTNSGDNTVSVFIGLTSPVVTPLAANVGP